MFTTRNLSNHTDLYIHAFGNHVTLTFDLLTSRSMHGSGSVLVVQLPCYVCLPSLVLIAQVMFF